MRIFSLIVLAFFAAPIAKAQSSIDAPEFDLNNMPADWRIEDDSSDGLSVLQFDTAQDGVFFFTYRFQVGTEAEISAEVELNSVSQTTFISLENDWARFFPHDCWPSIGTCSYVKIYSDGTSESYFTETGFVRGIHHMKTYFLQDSVPVLITIECFVLDDFGFASLFYQIDLSDGATYWSRTRQQGGALPEITMQMLEDTCNTPELTS